MATSRNNFRTASDVNRGCGSGRSAADPGGGSPGVGKALLEDAQFSFGEIELQPIELVVQQAHFLAIADPEGVVIRPGADHFGAPGVETVFALGQLRAQRVEIVTGLPVGRNECTHTKMIAKWRHSTST